MTNYQDVKKNVFLLEEVSEKSKAKIVSCDKHQKCFVKTKLFKKICTLSMLIVSISLFFLGGLPRRINYQPPWSILFGPEEQINSA